LDSPFVDPQRLKLH
jgi:cytochrome P450